MFFLKLTYTGDHIITELIHHVDRAAYDIHHNIVSITLILMYQGLYTPFSQFYYQFSNFCPEYQGTTRNSDHKTAVPDVPLYSRIISSVHKSGFLPCRMSYMLTGRMSDTHHIRLFSGCCSLSVYLMSLHASCPCSSLAFLNFCYYSISFPFSQ